MSNLTAVRRQLFGSPAPASRAPRPYDGMSKAELWTAMSALRGQLADANRAATVARNAISTLGTEGTAAYQPLASAREALRELATLTEARRG